VFPVMVPLSQLMKPGAASGHAVVTHAAVPAGSQVSVAAQAARVDSTKQPLVSAAQVTTSFPSQ
jgi:hypothetical protein